MKILAVLTELFENIFIQLHNEFSENNEKDA